MQNVEKINHKKTEGQSFLKGLRGVVEHLAALAAVSLLSFLAAKLGGQYFDKGGDMIYWLASIVGVASIGHALLISLHYLFPHGINIQRKLAPHIAVFSLLLFLLIATSSVTLLSLRKDKVIIDLTPQSITTLHLLRNLNEKISNDGKLEGRYVQDVLATCVNLITMKKGLKHVRVTVVYADKSKKNLLMPNNGFYGEGFDSDLPQNMKFAVHDKGDDETELSYKVRLGYAGWAFKNRKELIDNDIENESAEESWRLKDISATHKFQKDASMICIPIHKISNNKPDVIGVLSVSSIEKINFTDEEIEIARYMADILARFDANEEIAKP